MGDTFIQWPATRGPSLEDSKDMFTPWPATRGPSLEDDPKETFIHWPVPVCPSQGEFVGATPYTNFADSQWQVTQRSLQEESMDTNSYIMLQNLAALGALTA